MVRHSGWMAVIGVLLVAACGGSGGGPNDPLQPPPGPALAADTIQVSDNVFGPTDVKIVSGGMVTWTWNPANSQTHNVRWGTIPPTAMPPQGPTQITGSPFDVTLTVVGVYEYVCNLHAGMSGHIFVE